MASFQEALEGTLNGIICQVASNPGGDGPSDFGLPIVGRVPFVGAPIASGVRGIRQNVRRNFCPGVPPVGDGFRPGTPGGGDTANACVSGPDLVVEFCNNNPNFCNWVAYETWSQADDRVVSNIGGNRNTVWEAGERCGPNDDGITIIKDGRTFICARNAQRGRLLTLDYYLVCPSDPPTGGEPVPPTGPGYTGPITYDGPDGSPITIDVDISMDNPVIDEDGNLIIPFVYIDPDLELNPDVNIELEPEFGPGGNNCNPTIDPDFPDFPEGPDDPPPPEDGRRIAGIVVVATKTTTFQTTTEYRGENEPTLFLPRLASVVFAIDIGGQGCWTAPVDVEVLRQWVPVPENTQAYAFDVKPVNGFTIESYPVYFVNDDPIGVTLQ